MNLKKAIPFHLHLSYLFTGLILVFSLILGLALLHRVNQMILTDVSARYDLIGEQTARSILTMAKPIKNQVETLAKSPITQAKTLEQRLEYIGYMVASIANNELSNATYIGYPNGEFFMLRKWQDTPQLRALLSPPPGTAWVIQSLSLKHGNMVGDFFYFDQQLKLIALRGGVAYQFDPRTRPWYQNALAHNDSNSRATDAYYFASSGAVGFTYSTRSPKAEAVIGTDILLTDLQNSLSQEKNTSKSRIALLNNSGQVIALQNGSAQVYIPKLVTLPDGRLRLPMIKEVQDPILNQLYALGEMKHSRSFTLNQDDWEGLNLRLQIPGGKPLTLLIASPHDELLANARALRNQGMLLAGILLLGVIALAFFVSRLASRPMNQLSDETIKIQHFDFSESISIRSNITEIIELADSMNDMKSTIRSFLELSTSLASETNFERLLARILSELAEIADAQGGVIYLHDPKLRTLIPAHSHLSNLTPVNVGQIATLSLDELTNPIVKAAHNGTIIEQLDEARLDQLFGQESSGNATVIALPLKERNGTLAGVIAMQLANESVDPGQQAMIEAISGNAAVAIENQRLIQEQKTLLEAFIQLIAGAIDAKSPYTGGHCQRVPELTKMLAQAACEQSQGPFAEFNLNESEWEELHIAAWLHDCGKVTTPEYVVDKATKLETLYDRIHEIRMRFEVMKRDVHIRYWENLASGGDQKQLNNIREQELQRLDDDFAFVAHCNEGGEFMAQDKIERLTNIASQTWLRTLSDRLGISYEERQRKAGTPEAPLPTPEPLIADKPEHRFIRKERDKIAPDNPWGFKLNVPEYLYNRGELYNLCVGRGTLSEEERYKINEHIVQTIIMLEKLPFPRHLSRVPEIAGGHHEKMDGSGYPKRLTRNEMSLPARMMAIADIFEALTAIDRPYKKGKLLSEAIKIMSLMKKDQHIDADLFSLFLTSGVYRTYAERYLQAAQIDEFDISIYLV
ncbi:HD domain-containing phosphohydrolase [Chitinibacter sp. S2-10]|uniref:HD domain-containing phosphohydrolase n=1 Tax=Chitinibacter sp. S2-10 TaxID=3373597 RepID=UPI003977BD18